MATSGDPVMVLYGILGGAAIALVGVIYGHYVKRQGDVDQRKIALVTEKNDTEIESKKLDFEVLKATVETLRTDLATLRQDFDGLKTKLEHITRKYWRLVSMVRAWVVRYGIDANEIPHDLREDL